MFSFNPKTDVPSAAGLPNPDGQSVLFQLIAIIYELVQRTIGTERADARFQYQNLARSVSGWVLAIVLVILSLPVVPFAPYFAIAMMTIWLLFVPLFVSWRFNKLYPLRVTRYTVTAVKNAQEHVDYLEGKEVTTKDAMLYEENSMVCVFKPKRQEKLIDNDRLDLDEDLNKVCVVTTSEDLPLVQVDGGRVAPRDDVPKVGVETDTKLVKRARVRKANVCCEITEEVRKHYTDSSPLTERTVTLKIYALLGANFPTVTRHRHHDIVCKVLARLRQPDHIKLKYEPIVPMSTFETLFGEFDKPGMLGVKYPVHNGQDQFHY